jgi:tRNA-dihydrouridine synthase
MATGTHAPAPDLAERVQAVGTHLARSIAWKGERLGIVEMRRHYANYFKGLPDFKAFRNALVTTDEAEEIRALLDRIPAHYDGWALSGPSAG